MHIKFNISKSGKISPELHKFLAKTDPMRVFIYYKVPFIIGVILLLHPVTTVVRYVVYVFIL